MVLAYVLHHLSNFVFKEPSAALRFAKLEDVWSAVEAKCVFLRTATPVRTLSSILQNVFDAWMVLLGQPLPAIGRY
jgi:hypothetical protein